MRHDKFSWPNATCTLDGYDKGFFFLRVYSSYGNKCCSNTNNDCVFRRRPFPSFKLGNLIYQVTTTNAHYAP